MPAAARRCAVVAPGSGILPRWRTSECAGRPGKVAGAVDGFFGTSGGGGALGRTLSWQSSWLGAAFRLLAGTVAVVTAPAEQHSKRGTEVLRVVGRGGTPWAGPPRGTWGTRGAPGPRGGFR